MSDHGRIVSGDDDYIADLELQLSDLKMAVTLIQESHQAQSKLRTASARLTEIELKLSSISSCARLLIEGFNRYGQHGASWDDVRPLLVDLGCIIGETVADPPVDTGSSPDSSPNFSHRRPSLILRVRKRPSAPIPAAPVRTAAVDDLDRRRRRRSRRRMTPPEVVLKEGVQKVGGSLLGNRIFRISGRRGLRRRRLRHHWRHRRQRRHRHLMLHHPALSVVFRQRRRKWR